MHHGGLSDHAPREVIQISDLISRGSSMFCKDSVSELVQENGVPGSRTTNIKVSKEKLKAVIDTAEKYACT